jgi:hypothetical protein
MNCKPDELAVMVRSAAGNEGRIVRCLRLATLNELLEANWNRRAGPVWVVDQILRTSHHRMAPLANDAWLRPIRPGDISDEEVRDLYSPIKEAA